MKPQTIWLNRSLALTVVQISTKINHLVLYSAQSERLMYSTFQNQSTIDKSVCVKKPSCLHCWIYDRLLVREDSHFWESPSTSTCLRCIHQQFGLLLCWRSYKAKEGIQNAGDRHNNPDCFRWLDHDRIYPSQDRTSQYFMSSIRSQSR